MKYGVKLPQEFIDYVMSDEGTAYLEEYYKDKPSWKKNIQDMKNQKDMLCLLPDDAGDEPLEDF